MSADVPDDACAGGSRTTRLQTEPGAAEPSFSRSRLAIVEDDEELRERIMVPALRAAGFDAVGLANALQLYRMWASAPFDLVLLDVGLPDEDGIEIARHLRGLSPSLGIVMYTGHGRAADRMRGLRAGVDAYLVKPADMDEVIETLRNVRDRRGNGDPTLPASGKWSLDRRGWSLSTPSGVVVTLNQAERQIMRILAAAPDHPVSRETLIANLTSDAEGFDPHRLEMLVYRLRRKCLDTSGEALPLRAVRSVGYLFEP
ncbi:MAG: response regulator transcription factor [Thermomonas sp.]